MSRYARLGAALAFAGVLSAAAGAQEKSVGPWQAVVRSTLPPAGQGAPPALTPRHSELVRQVNAYFNRVGQLRGTFTQTAAGGKRQRGIFHIARPGRFRFEFAPPNRLVVLSDGRQVAVQDYDLKTDDRSDLAETPFRALLQRDVDLLRDARIYEVREAGETITIAFADARTETAGNVALVLASKPVMQVKGWVTRDSQGLETRIDLADIETVESIDQKLFDLAARIERRQW